MSNAFLSTIKERGYLYQVTDEPELENLLNKERHLPIYIGFDCTAKSLHVGSLVQIMMLRWIQKLGYKPIILLGGGTTKVGDPSGKDQTRQLQNEAGIAENLAGIQRVFDPFINFGDGESDALVVNNDEWLAGLNYIEFLRDVGRHFSVNRMLSFESVKQRLDREQNLSFLEFNYMLLQAYDFVALYRRYACRVQIGGSDQWGNIVSGMELARRMGEPELFGLTTPLITTASGAKMGKTAEGAVWLTDDLTSDYDYWQFWRNTEDQDVGRFLRLFTELPMDEIIKLEALEGAELNQAKIILANEATALCRGQEAAEKAAQTAKQVFEQGGVGDDLPEIQLAEDALSSGVVIFKLLHQAGLAESGGAARRLIKGGGVRINDVKIHDENLMVGLEQLNSDGVIKLSAGKKKHALVKIYSSLLKRPPKSGE